MNLKLEKYVKSLHPTVLVYRNDLHNEDCCFYLTKHNSEFIVIKVIDLKENGIKHEEVERFPSVLIAMDKMFEEHIRKYLRTKNIDFSKI